jgi:uncharacterized protein YdhG (YjbR/CyaY superfamily)
MRTGRVASENIDAYIASFPPKVQAILKKMRLTIRRAAPEAHEKISYRMPAFFQGGALAYFAAFQNHIGFFPPVEGDARLKKAVSPYAGPKGNLRFAFDQPIPYGLIERIVKLRVKQNLAKAAAKGKKKASATRSKAMPSKAPTAPRLKAGQTATAGYPAKLARYEQSSLALWAADCAEHVIAHFERLRRSDRRPRQAIEAARAWARDEIRCGAARAAALAAHAAARECDDPAATAAARAAGHAAATAHMAGHSRHAAAYAIVATIAAAPPNRQDAAIKSERDWQLSRLPTR